MPTNAKKILYMTLFNHGEVEVRSWMDECGLVHLETSISCNVSKQKYVGLFNGVLF
jgi:hypothetical protein